MPKPAAVSDIEKFLHLLDKSTLLTAEQMAQTREMASQHEDVKSVARALVKNNSLTKWQAMQLLAGWNGFRIDKYHLLTQLGSGQHSRIYVAEHRAMNRRVVLRTLPRRSAERPELLKRFLNEARASSALDHRNIIHVYDVNTEGDRYFVVMEYVDGRNLMDVVVDDGPLTPTQAVDYVRQAAEGLIYAHGEGVIHRELSPGKLIVDPQGQLKILEMGISGLDEPSESASTDVSGGPGSAGAYLAPEQCQSQPQADERTDVYALGATLYFLLAGKSPVAASASAKPADVLSQRADVPKTLVELCQKMMAPDPAERFQSAKELKEALDKWLSQQRPAAPPVRRKPAEATAAPDDTGPMALKTKGQPAKGKAPAKVVEEPLDEAPSGGFPVFDGDGPRKATKTAPVKTKKAAASKKTKPAKEETVAETETDEEGNVVAPAKKGLPLALIIGAAVGGVALLLIVGIGIGMMMMGGKEKPVIAKVEDPKTATTTTPEEKKKPEAPANEKPVAKPVEPVEPEKQPEPMPTVDQAPMPMVDPVPPATDPAPPVDPVKPADPVTPPPDPAPMPAPMPPAIETFADFAATVDVPVLTIANKPNPDATKATSLGVMKLEPGGLIFPKLVGGEKATAGKSTLTMTNANGGSAEREWEITATDAKSGAQVVAKLALKESENKELKDSHELFFQWTPEGAQSPTVCAGLINCAIDIAAGPKTHRLALRKPIAVAPLSINLEKAMDRMVFEIPNAPDPSAIKFEILKVEGNVKATADKAQLGFMKESAFITFGEKLEEQMLMMKVETAIKPKPGVTIAPHLKTDNGPEKLVLKKFMLSKAQLVGQQNQTFAGIEQLKTQKATPEQIQRAETQMEQLNALMAKMTAAETQMKAINASTIQFRVYYAPEEGDKIELVTTTAAGPAGNIPKGDDPPKLNLEGK
jgi:serine/threonine protein kinase